MEVVGNLLYLPLKNEKNTNEFCTHFYLILAAFILFGYRYVSQCYIHVQ